ncbi:MAG: VWA domain-containing protein, partial [Planctomycetales bacterium]
EPSASKNRRLRRTVAAWKPHPLLSILRLDEQVLDARADDEDLTAAEWTVRNVKRLDRLGESIRARLSGLSGEIEGQLQDWRKAAQDAPTPWRLRSPASEADAVIRETAAVWYRPPDVRPARELRDADLHNLALWHAQRTISDFWGPADPGDGPEGSFFYLAGDSYLKTAKNLCQIGGAYTAIARETRGRLNPRLEAVERGFLVEAHDPDAITDTEQKAVEHDVKVAMSPSFPAGNAALFARNSEHGVMEIERDNRFFRRLGFPVRGQVASTELQLRNRYRVADLGDDRRPGVICLYRGHRRRASFYVSQPAWPIELAFERPRYEPPRISVVSGAETQGHVVFVLDCSGSMSSEVAGEVQTTRMKAAKRALTDMLEQLAADGRYHVGVVLFGHRVTFDKTWNLTRSAYADPKEYELSADVRPWKDVEVILPVSREKQFDRSRLAEVKRKLAKVGAHGFTPLYLSLLTAIDQLKGRSSEHRQSIVVITDGKNVQEAHPNRREGFQPNKLGEVTQAAASHGRLSIHIAGFDLDKDRAEAESAFNEIARKTGGRYTHVTGSEQLSRTLEQALQDFYDVKRNGQDPDQEHFPKRFGELHQLEAVRPGAKETCEVRVSRGRKGTVATGEFQVLGGEFYELQLSQDRRSLLFPRYQGRSHRWAERLADPLEPSQKVTVGLHKPQWKGSLLEFPISVQNDQEGQFSRHPDEVWAEIRPIARTGGRRMDPYVIYDLAFQSRRPAPIIRCLVPRWPAEEAETAEVRFWCKFGHTKPARTESLRQIINQTESDAALDLSFKAKIRPADGQTHVIVELTAGKTKDAFAVKPAMFPPADAVRRRFNVKEGMSVHTFVYERRDESEILNDELRLYARRSLQAGAVEVPAVEVVVPPKVSTVK